MVKQNIKNLIPDEVLNVSKTLSKAGFENYLVGGCVRDLVLGRTPKDWDIATIATPAEIEKAFSKTFYENDFGTVGVVNEDTEDETLKVVEVTPYRIEGKYEDYRRPSEVRWGENIEEDLSRRDFTVNAMALSLQPTTDNQQLIDPFDGQKDLEKKIIRTVGEPEKRFGEDALRMLRALRLASELDFVIEHDTQSAISKLSELMANISKERIRDEFIRIIMSGNPAIALDLSQRLGLLKFISPELERGVGVEQGGAHAYNVWEHLLRCLDHAAKKNYPLHTRLVALLHDIAKPHTRRKAGEKYTFYGHEVVGARVARKLMEDLRFPKDLVEKVTKMVRWHMFFSDTEEITHSAVRRVVRNVGGDLIWDLIDARKADRIGTGRPKEEPYRLRKYESMIEEVMRDPISVKQLKVGGEDVMKLTNGKGGPHVGAILEILLSEVLEDPKKNTKEYLEKRVGELHKLKLHELIQEGKLAKAKNENADEEEVKQIKEGYKVK